MTYINMCVCVCIDRYIYKYVIFLIMICSTTGNQGEFFNMLSFYREGCSNSSFHLNIKDTFPLTDYNWSFSCPFFHLKYFWCNDLQKNKTKPFSLNKMITFICNLYCITNRIFIKIILGVVIHKLSYFTNFHLYWDKQLCLLLKQYSL